MREANEDATEHLMSIYRHKGDPLKNEKNFVKYESQGTEMSPEIPAKPPKTDDLLAIVTMVRDSFGGRNNADRCFSELSSSP